MMIPLLVLLFHAIHRHYVSLARQLSLDDFGDPMTPVNNTVIVPISGIHRGVIDAIRYARSISGKNVTAVYVDFEDEATARLKERWKGWVRVSSLQFYLHRIANSRGRSSNISDASPGITKMTSSRLSSRNLYPPNGGSTCCIIKVRCC